MKWPEKWNWNPDLTCFQHLVTCQRDTVTKREVTLVLVPWLFSNTRIEHEMAEKLKLKTQGQFSLEIETCLDHKRAARLVHVWFLVFLSFFGKKREDFYVFSLSGGQLRVEDTAVYMSIWRGSLDLTNPESKCSEMTCEDSHLKWQPFQHKLV